MNKEIDIDELNERFETARAEEIFRWAVETFAPKTALSSSFGAQSAVLLHMGAAIDPNLPVLFVDTGFLFKETHEFKEALRRRLNLNIRTFLPTEAELADARERLKTDRFACCDKTKVVCMERALEGVNCWVSGLRRQQASTRKSVKIIEKQRSGLIKVHPIANWTSKDVYDYMKRLDLPFHPLWDKGYTSIGCEPCTARPADPSDERSGRWAGTEKTECGIHTVLDKKDEPDDFRHGANG